MLKLIEETVTNEKWKKIFTNDSNITNYFGPIYDSIDKNLLLTDKVYLPKREQVLRCFNYFDPVDTKVVLIGQDPYHTYCRDDRGNIVPTYACGLSFSFPNSDVKLKKNSSLYNIFRELYIEYDNLRIDPYLEDWAKAGVLLLNSVLTVEPGKSKSHAKVGWKEFTDTVVSILSYTAPNAVYLLLGKDAQKKIRIIKEHNQNARFVLANHPSPLNRYGGFINSDCFKRVNEFFKKKDMINWI